MVASFFKNNDRLGFILIPVAGLAIWGFSFIHPKFHEIDHTYSFLLSLLEGRISAGFLSVINLLATIGGAYLLSFLCLRQEITEKQNLIPAFIYLVLCGCLNADRVLHPLLIGNLFVIGGLYLMFSTYREDRSLSQIFDAGLLFSLAILFYQPLIVFIPVSFAAILILRSFRLKEWLLLICGMLLPMLLFSCILYLINKPQSLLFDFLKSTTVKFHWIEPGTGSFLIHSIGVLLLLLGVYNSMYNSGNFKIKSQKTKNLFIWFTLLGVSGLFFTNEYSFFKGALIMIPFSIYVGDYLGNIRKSALREFLTFLLIAAYVFSCLLSAGYL